MAKTQLTRKDPNRFKCVHVVQNGKPGTFSLPCGTRTQTVDGMANGFLCRVHQGQVFPGYSLPQQEYGLAQMLGREALEIARLRDGQSIHGDHWVDLISRGHRVYDSSPHVDDTEAPDEDDDFDTYDDED